MKEENMGRMEENRRGGEGGETKQSAGKTYLGMRREIQVTSSFTGTAARHQDKKHMQATKAGVQTQWHRQDCL